MQKLKLTCVMQHNIDLAGLMRPEKLVLDPREHVQKERDWTLPVPILASMEPTLAAGEINK